MNTTAQRLPEGAMLGDGTTLKNDFIASNGLSVHILDQRLFRIMHLMEGEPAFERHDSLVSSTPRPTHAKKLCSRADQRFLALQIMHQTCADDKWVKLYMTKAQVSDSCVSLIGDLRIDPEVACRATGATSTSTTRSRRRSCRSKTSLELLPN